jgi:two-component sensor histidine kinase
MDELLAPRGLAAEDADVLHRLVGDWQLLADLSFADLVLFVPEPQGRFTVVAQMRPTTGPTSYQEDLVGTVVTATERPQLAAALADGRIVREGDPVWFGGVPVREEVLPVTSNGRVIAVIARDTNLAAARTPSRLEIAYLNSANDLAQMLAEGRWPYPGEAARNEGSGPRVGDGLIRLDPDGTVTFASPNALSAYRRLGHPGDLAGARLSQVTGGLADRRHAPLDEPVAVLARGRVPRSGDVEAADAIIALRALPLWPGGEHIGALVLVRDVTELRRHERQLLSKDATIREIHHRVKNNLQTVAALLRLQARRMEVPQARIALEESVRRVSSIAVVHETLSGSLEENVPFDEVADRVLAMIADVGGSAVTVRRRGSFGVLSAELATPLAMVLTELVQNAVEHGYDAQQAGSVEIRVERGEGDRLRVQVVDDGRGLPAGFALADSARLGLQIVRTLVGTELGGSLEVESASPGGTVVTVTLGG